MDVAEGTRTEDLWTPFKELVAVVESYLTKEGEGAPYAVHTFESVLRRHKQSFLSLLKNPPKNPNSREEIKRGITDGVTLPSIGRTLLSKEIVEEALILSDMYNVNEYLALELVHSGQRQSPRHPGLPRGLVAALLYYDGRRALAQALKELCMARDGVSWSIPAREEITQYVTRYVEQLIADGLLGNTLDALRRFTLAAELELLQANRALPPRQHHARLVDTIETTRKLMAGTIFAASAQRGLNHILLRLIEEQSSSPTLGPTGALDDVSLALHMALLYALDLSVLYRRDDGEELAKKLPLIQDPELVAALVDELCPPTNPNQSAQEAGDKTAGAKAMCQLALGLALAALKRAPQSLQRASGRELRADLLEQDEALVDAAVDGKVFEYLADVVLANDQSCEEEYYQRRLHTLITDFIVLMHPKLMEMRLKADEAARAVQMYAAEGLAPPPAAAPPRSRLTALLRCIERLYRADRRDLRLDYWRACETMPHSHRSNGRAATLYKFTRAAASLSGACAGAGLRALASLAAPRHAWALLAREPAAAPRLLLALQVYRQNLSSPVPEQLRSSSMGASALASRPSRLLMRHEEVEAMIAALRLLAAVARQDAAAAAAICENLQWDAVNVMFGLICCHVPLQLKAELCLTLAALGGSAATAPRVWAALEAARLVAAGKDARGLTQELLEVECRMEEYPLTRAFLTLLSSLCACAPLPRALGAGGRAPGLAPYVEHVVARIALPAPHRSYARPEEKWQVLALSLSLLAQWLEDYSPSAGEFPARGGGEALPPPPGMLVALRLHAGDELLRLVLAVLREALDDLVLKQPHHVFVEQCLESSLQLLARGLEIERALVRCAAEAGRSVLVVGLSKLLLAEDAGDDERQPLVCACLALGRAASLPRVAARAVVLLQHALRHAPAHGRLLHAAARCRTLQTLIRHSFVECLEAEEWLEGEPLGALRRAKEGVLALLLQALPAPAPNLAHLLLGYRLAEDVSRSSLHEAGAAGFPRTCLHSILDILDQHVSGADSADRQATELVEGCYRLVYCLCARAATAAPALRFLRARDLLPRHVTRTVPLESASASTLSARSWLLRACAAAAGGAAGGRQHAALGALLHALAPRRDAARDHAHAQVWERSALRRSLAALPVRVEPAREPRWELFRAQQLRQALDAADLPAGEAGKRISVSRVHALLTRELVALQATAPQRNLVAAEIQKVLDYVTEVNRRRNLAATLTHYFDSWRQFTEILFCVTPQDMLDIDTRKNLLLNILQDILNKINPSEVLPQIGNLASGTVLLLMVNLRHCYILQKRDSNLESSEFETTFFGPTNQIMQTKSLTLKFILHKILSWIMVSGGSTQKMRVNLYGALLNFLNIVNLKHSPAETMEVEANTTYVSRLDASKAQPERDDSALKSMVVDVISDFGQSLCALVCSDCIGAGHSVCRLVALSCLDTLADIDPHTDWMRTLVDQGYLRSLVDSLLQDDEGLKEALEPNPKSLRVLFVYESKMALLTKIAGTRCGAETVLAGGALACLAGLRALAVHPDLHAPARPAHAPELIPSVADRFRQILLPAYALCHALLTTLGAQNHSCVVHVTHFLLSHIECLDLLLRAVHPHSDGGLLTELEAVTGVVARAATRHAYGGALDDTALRRAAPALQRLRALMLALLPRFAAAPRDRHALLHYQIVCNLLTYARNILERDSSRVLFRPALAPSADGAPGAPDEGPSCGAIVALVQGAVHRCHATEKQLATLSHQIQNLPTMTIEDMRKLLPEEAAAAAPVDVRRAARALLSARAAAHAQQRTYCRHAAEAALYLVWAHLHVFLRRAVCLEDGPNTSMSGAAALQGAWGGGELAELRKGLVAVFNDRFAEDLLNTAQNQPASQRGFLEVLLKDIKSMIQFSPL